MLADSFLQLTRLSGEPLDSNDNHATHPWASLIPSRVSATDPNEAVLMASLEPGGYTALLYGADGGTGIAIVEVFEIQDSEVDIDSDGQMNDVDTDDDGDGIPDDFDSFPNDLTRAGDPDADGIDSVQDTDDDGDGTPDTEDPEPFNSEVSGNGNNGVCVFDQSNWDECNFE